MQNHVRDPTRNRAALTLTPTKAWWMLRQTRRLLQQPTNAALGLLDPLCGSDRGISFVSCTDGADETTANPKHSTAIRC